MGLTAAEQAELDQLEGAAKPSGGLTPEEQAEMSHLEGLSAPKDEIPPAASASAGFLGALPGAASVGAAGKTAMDVLTGGTDAGDALDEYRNQRDILKGDLRSTADANPKSAIAGGVVGGAMLPIGATAKGMAAYGALSGAANSDADLTKGEVLQTGKDAVKGGTLGLGAGLAGNAIGKIGSKVTSPVADWISAKLAAQAEKKAVAATGATGVQASKFDGNAGRELLDRGIVRFGDGQKRIAERAGDALEQSGKGIGETLDALDKQGVTVDRNTVLAALRKKASELSGDESQKGLVNQIKARIADIEEQIPGSSADFESAIATEAAAPSSIPIGKAEQIKRGFDKNAKWSSNSDAANLEANRAAGNAYRTASEEAAVAANPELASKFKADKETMHLLKPIAEAAERRAMTTAQHAPGGFLDTTAALAGGAAGGPHAAIAAPIARRIIAPSINSAVAVSTDQVAKLVAQSPQALGKFAEALTRAAARGPEYLDMTNRILQKTDPEYREQLKLAQGRATAGK